MTFTWTNDTSVMQSKNKNKINQRIRPSHAETCHVPMQKQKKKKKISLRETAHVHVVQIVRKNQKRKSNKRAL